MKNVLSVDVEDYFHVEAFRSMVRHDHWESYESRVERNVIRILDLFARHNATATFFVLGWVADRYPDLVRQIAAAGHEVGSHGYAHQRLMELGPDGFRQDLRRSLAALSDRIQQPVQCYRAPSFSIVKKTFWAFDILAEEGIRYDSSIFPVHHDLYGVPDGERFLHSLTTSSGSPIVEFPPSTVRYRNRNWGVGGGGYFRLIPYRATKWALGHINAVEKQPAMVYFHPWEIDPEQPRIRAGVRSTLRHYTNLATTYERLARLLSDFTFTTLSDACRLYGPAETPRFADIVPGRV